MTLPDHIHALVSRAADRYDLPAALIRAIIRVESAGNPLAVRAEPAFLRRYIESSVTTYGASLETERWLRACSFGLMQVMGQVARELRCTEPFLTALCDPATGIDYGCKLLARLRDRYVATRGWDAVIAAYNAGSPRIEGDRYVNQGYVDKVLKYWRQEQEKPS